MKESNTLLSLTMDLLAHDAFKHLGDDEINALQQLAGKISEPLTPVNQGLLLTYWNFASTSGLPAPLLNRCNRILQQLVPNQTVNALEKTHPLSRTNSRYRGYI
jgi:hypothetical protein